MNKKLKRFALIILILCGVLLAYSVFIKKAPVKPTSSLSTTSGLPISNTTSQKSSADEFSTLLSSIKQISIDTSLFSNNAYKMLRDFPVSLGTDSVGRNNPFAPVGVDSDSGTTGVAIQTIAVGKITSTTAEFGAQVSLTDTVPTSVVFEYGPNESFGSLTTPIPVSKNGTVLTTVTKLLPETIYFVRAIAVHGSSNIVGNTTPFTTNKK